MTSVKDIRRTFLDYFVKQGHQEIASSPLLPDNDPTLMFVNSGMVQFKNVFTGAETRPYSRATTSQKCVRAGGKHNDLDNVGYTARHHTFFEMLGNFSFGDYFKDDAIAFAWELITRDYGLPKDKLLVTVHSSDEDAAGIWKKVAGLSDDKIIRIPTSDNFWMMGDTGPCGPCSEIFYDHGPDVAGGPPGSPDEDGDRFIEIWNLVFMQFEQFEDKERINLPKPSIDTGMGLERIAAILQGKHNNYDIDLMRALVEASADLTSVDPDGPQAASHRVIADHLRSAAFLMADGVMPSNEGRGYVLRRIMRRGMRHAHLLGASEPLMHRLIPELVTQMGEAYPELVTAQAMITSTLEQEETRFKKTLDRGLALLDEETEKLGDAGTLAGDVAFKLYDTYGFPVDLTADALRGKGMQVDMDGFNTAMDAAREKARASWGGSGDAGTEKLYFALEERLGVSEFLGYDRHAAEAEITAIIKDGQEVESVESDDHALVLVNQTPFYAESGGQVGDIGVMTAVSGEAQATVTNCTKKLGALWLHHVHMAQGSLKKGDPVHLQIDSTRRNAVTANHSATHLLHESLRRHLGDHVAQKGSLQDDCRTRFDIAQPVAVTAEQLRAVEYEVNEQIRANTAVATRVMPLDEAKESGARALFGEKYGDEVRVVSMGTQEQEGQPVFSVELCGGTHVKSTGEIGLFHILSESAVSAGIRRVEAVAGPAALTYLSEQDERLRSVAGRLNVPAEDVESRVSALLDAQKKMEKELSDLRRKLAAGGGASQGGSDAKDINGVKFVARILEGIPAGELKPLADDLKAQEGSAVIALVAVNDGKASLVVGVTDDLTDRYNAVELVKAGAQALGGKGGGGRPDMAQAGGPNGAAANDAVSSIEQAI